MRTPFPALLLLSSLLMVASCQSAADLEPADPAQEVMGLQDAAVSEVDGVRLTTQAVGWPGPRPIATEVTPVRVVVENGSERDLRVRYREFALVDRDGHRYSALPPWQMQGTVSEEVTARVVAPVAEPEFVHRGFYVAPAYHGVYPAWDPWTGPFAYDPFYYDTYATYWREIPLPTDAMRARGLPEGVLAAGGRLEGWLYFEHVDPSLERVTFRFDLVDADAGRDFGEVRIPFTVD